MQYFFRRQPWFRPPFFAPSSSQSKVEPWEGQSNPPSLLESRSTDPRRSLLSLLPECEYCEIPINLRERRTGTANSGVIFLLWELVRPDAPHTPARREAPLVHRQ